MQSPRTPGGGIAGASGSLGGDNSEAYISRAGLLLKLVVAAALDRQADLHLAEGRTRRAELLAHQAEAMRMEAAR